MTLGQELESAPVVPLGLGDVELDGPVAGQDEEAASGRLEPLALVQGASCARELERLAVVVGEDLRLVRPISRQPLHPARRGLVLTHAREPRDLPIGDVADEDMPECVLGLALD